MTPNPQIMYFLKDCNLENMVRGWKGTEDGMGRNVDENILNILCCIVVHPLCLSLSSTFAVQPLWLNFFGSQVQPLLTLA